MASKAGFNFFIFFMIDNVKLLNRYF